MLFDAPELLKEQLISTYSSTDVSRLDVFASLRVTRDATNVVPIHSSRRTL